MKYRSDIDGLRTLAVVPVVVYHAGLGFSGGFVGVDVFFVISGFLITTLLINDIEGGRFSLIDFYERRARRIFPALFTMIGVTTAVALWILSPFDLDAFSKSAISATAFLANIWFYTQDGYFTEAAELKPLLHTWSLGVEEQFYVLFPPLLWLIYKGLRGRFIVLTLGLLAIASLVFAEMTVRQEPSAAFYLPHLRAWELLIGSILAVAMARGWRLSEDASVVNALGVAGLALIITALFAFDPETRFPGVSALLPCIGAALLIATGHVSGSLIGRLLSLRPMVFVGKLSYSLYLWHWPVIVFFYYTNGEYLSPAMGLLCIAISVALAYLSWRYVEQPFRNRAFLTRGAVFASSAVAMVAIIGIGGWTAKSDGFPGRMPPEILALSNGANFIHDRRDCHFVTPERAGSDDVCLRGETSAPASFVLVGDSHADALSPAVFEAAKSLGLAGYQYTGPGFLPLPGIWRDGFGHSDEPIEAFVNFVQSRPDISVVFLTGYWQNLVTGYTYRHSGLVWRDADYAGQGSSYNPIAAKGGLERLAKRLGDVRLVLLDDVPSGRDLHVRTQVRRIMFGGARAPGLPTSEAMEQRAGYEGILNDLALANPGIDYRPIFDAFCGPDVCPMFDGDTLLFRDGDHLSWEGALMFTDEMASLLQEFLPHNLSTASRDVCSGVDCPRFVLNTESTEITSP